MEEAGMFLFVMAVGGKLQTNNMTFPNFVLNFSQLRLEILYTRLQFKLELNCLVFVLGWTAVLQCRAVLHLHIFNL